MRNTAKMHRSTGSPPQCGKRSHSSSPLEDGGRKKASKSVPTNAQVAIRAFFGRKIGVLMLLQFLVSTETPFNWNAYQGSLPEVQLTAEVVATWLLTLMLRKPASGEAVVTDDVWHHVLQFLRENAHLVELKPLFDFIKKYQKETPGQEKADINEIFNTTFDEDIERRSDFRMVKVRTSKGWIWRKVKKEADIERDAE